MTRLSHRIHELHRAYRAASEYERVVYCHMIRSADTSGIWLTGHELQAWLRSEVVSPAREREHC